MTNTVLKAQIDSQITNKTAQKSVTAAQVGGNMKEVVDYVDQQVPYKTYSALLTQESTGVPIAYIAKNDANLTIVFTRISAGKYTGTLSSGFVPNKTTIITGSVGGEEIFTSIFLNTTNINLRTFSISSGTPDYFDDLLTNTFFQIRIYN